MKWVTRERAKVDRIACPWLIKRFIDPGAEFLFVPSEEVLEVAEREGAMPFDISGVELGHHGERCSFDAFVKKYSLTRLVWWEEHPTVPAAIQRETSIKRWKRNWKIDLINKNNPKWLDLYEIGDLP